MKKTPPKSYCLRELAELLGARLSGDPDRLVRGINTLEQAGTDEVTFLANKRYASLAESSRAAAVIVDPAHAHLEQHLLIVDQPYVAMARTAQLFAPAQALAKGVSALAFIAEDAVLADHVRIGPFVRIGTDTRIDQGSIIQAGVHIGHGVQIGADCLIYPNVTILDRTVIGDRVIIHSGTVIGSDGYGFAQDQQGRHVKIPQTGIVQIDNDVEIGSNCSIDRATFGRTWIQQGCKIDNLVQVAHNVTVGQHSLLVSQVGIAGSTSLGHHVVLGGKVGVAGHLKIADGVRVGASSGIAHSITKTGDMLGSPAVPIKEWMRTYANLQRLPRLKEEVKSIRKRLDELEQILAHSPQHESAE